MKLWQYISRKMLKHPEQTIHDRDVCFTYKQFFEKVISFSTQLENIEKCVVYCHSELFAAIAILACLASGTTVIPLPARYGEKYCRKIIQKVESPAIIMDSFGALSIHHVEKHSPQPSDKPALIMCTSGTTGSPKGIQLSEDNLL